MLILLAEFLCVGSSSEVLSRGWQCLEPDQKTVATKLSTVIQLSITFVTDNTFNSEDSLSQPTLFSQRYMGAASPRRTLLPFAIVF